MKNAHHTLNLNFVYTAQCVKRFKVWGGASCKSKERKKQLIIKKTRKKGVKKGNKKKQPKKSREKEASKEVKKKAAKDGKKERGAHNERGRGDMGEGREAHNGGTWGRKGGHTQRGIWGI